MSKREHSQELHHETTHIIKKQRVTSTPSFSPIKIASKENADAADANTPFLHLSNAMNDKVANPAKGRCIVFWMRMTDLRIKDNRGLAQASEQACRDNIPLVVLFVVSPQDYLAHDRGARKIDFTLRNLSSVEGRLAELHIPLHAITVSRRKAVVSEVLSFLDFIGCTKLFANIEYEVDELRRDVEICRLAKKSQKQVNLYHNKCMVEPGIIQSKNGKAYAVFSPYLKQWTKVINEQLAHYLSEASLPRANPPSVHDCSVLGPLFHLPLPTFVQGFELEDDEALTIRDLWPEGEDHAAQILQRFLCTKARDTHLESKLSLSNEAVYAARQSRISQYHTERDRADKDSTSRLSPYLSSGIISIRDVMRAIMRRDEAKKLNIDSKTGPSRFVQELSWRDFYTDVLASFPRVSMGRPFLEKYSEVVWENHQAPGDSNLGQPGKAYQDGEALRRWKEGMTGVPIVDAAMRCMNQTGWLHNRTRMIVAMYLAKHLMIDWRVGERYFMQQLIDGDLASNNGGWQWSASTGVDPCPYFRIFNPYTQSTKADPAGDFIRHWVPELQRLRGRDLHNPSSTLAKELNYPLPTVAHKDARARALRRFKTPGQK